MTRIISIMAAMLLAASAASQPPPPPPPESGTSLWDNLELDMVGLFTSGDVERQASKVQLGWRQDFGRGSFALSANIEQRETTLMAELKDWARFECSQNSYSGPEEDCEPERELSIEDDPGVQLEELYLNLQLADSLELGLGQTSVGWGQFLLISPVNFLLPQSLGADMGLSRNTLQHAQPHLSLKWAPMRGLAVEAYHFAEVRPDRLLATIDAADYNGEKSSGPDITADEVYESLTDNSQSALRLLWQSSWGAVGLTWLDGVTHFNTYRPERISRHRIFMPGDNDNQGFYHVYKICPLQTAANDSCAGGENATEDALERSVSNIGQLSDASALGIEISVVLGGGFSLIAEAVRIESEQRPFSLQAGRRIREQCPDQRGCNDAPFLFDGDPNPAFLQDDHFGRNSFYFNEGLLGCYDFAAGRLAGANKAAFDECRMDTNANTVGGGMAGLNVADETLFLASIGIEKLSTADTGWSYSLQLLLFQQQFDMDNFDGLNALWEATGNDAVDSLQIFPGFYALNNHRFMGMDGSMVFGMGFFASFAGVSALWNLDVSEHFSLQLGLEALTRVSDEQRLDSEGEGDRYELAGGGGPQTGFNLGLRIHL